MTDENGRCPHCGRPLAEGGTCPACLLQLGLDDGDKDARRPRTESGSGSPLTGDGTAPPDRIGDWKILHVLGEGGMGVVYLAEELGPLGRRGALKRIKHGLDSRQVLDRFDQERRVLARLDHAGIARALDASTAVDGTPFFVMEYVDGLPITEYCDKHRLTFRERLELFVRLCDAVDHAHRRGILHRDLKPSNILVVDGEDGPQPKVIDFGVARAIAQHRLEWSVFTEFGRLVGTPEYMSPEQADLDNDDLDTRSDVYGLGVVLYELLVGTTPHDPESLRKIGLQALLQTIRESDFPTPSSRLSTLGDRVGEIAEDRGLDPERLRRGVVGELDWIVMRATERDRDRRYGSSRELGDDIQRYLAEEPVMAGPPGAAYRVGKFARKHRLAVGIAASALVALVAFAALMAWSAHRIARERDQVLRLADMKRLTDYVEQAEHLWPAHPERIPELTAWLDERGRPLAARLEQHRRDLERLRARALPYGEEQRAEDRRNHPRAQELRDAREILVEVRHFLEATASRPPFPDQAEIVEYRKQQIAETEARIAELERQVEERRSWQFRDQESQWQHQMLTQLVARLETFVDPDPFRGTLASVEDRLEFARTIADRSIGGEHADAWREAIAAIEASPRYGGLQLTPQLGLVPLGEDPESGLWEFQDVGSGARPRLDDEPGAPDRWIVDGETGVIFVLVPGGSFWMGAQATDPEGRNFDPSAQRRERPPMEIELAPFFLSKYEMTQGAWQRLTGSNPSHHPVGNEFAGRPVPPGSPVATVSWHDANRTLTRHGMVLPTEAQWEYAARAGTTTRWWTGDDPASIEGAGNLADRTLQEAGAPASWTFETWLDDGWAIHAPVGQFRANPFGLHDTIGNQGEWCREHYRSPYTRWIDPGDGYRKVPGGTASRIVRGGSWKQSALDARSTYRGSADPATVNEDYGVRPARRIEPAPPDLSAP